MKSTIALPLSLLSGIIKNGIAIDSGIRCTKIVFFDKKEVDVLRFCNIENSKLKETLMDIRTLYADSLYKIGITGINHLWVKNIVESLFEVEIFLVEENSAFSKGYELILDHLNMADIEYQGGDSSSLVSDFKIEKSNFISNMIKSFSFESNQRTENDDSIINASSIFIMSDTLTKYFIIKDKSVQPINITPIGELTLRGLSNCISNVSDFEQIIKMACSGNREHVDTQVFEVFSENENSPYGKLPPNIPIFAFGKLADMNKGREEFHDNDLMESLYQLMSSVMAANMMTLCKAYKIKTVYMCGPIYNVPNFWKNLNVRVKMMFAQFNIKIVNCDYLSAIGTLKL